MNSVVKNIMRTRLKHGSRDGEVAFSYCGKDSSQRRCADNMYGVLTVDIGREHGKPQMFAKSSFPTLCKLYLGTDMVHARHLRVVCGRHMQASTRLYCSFSLSTAVHKVKQ